MPEPFSETFEHKTLLLASLKSTVPVAPFVTVAVKVSGCPIKGFASEALRIVGAFVFGRLNARIGRTPMEF
jgi:hypothetical protein